VGANILTSAGVYARGDENNQDVNGQLPGYTSSTSMATTRCQSGSRYSDGPTICSTDRYFNFGVVGENFFTGPGRTFGPVAGTDPRAEQFRGPGAPLGLWLGVAVFLWIRAPTAAGDAD